MHKIKAKKVVIVVIAAALGLAVGAGWGQVRVRGLQKIHQAKVKELTNRLNQEHRRLTEGQGLQEALEQEKQGMLKEADKLRSEKEGLAGQNATLKAGTDSLKAKADSLEAKTSSQEKRLASLESSKGHLAESLAKTEKERSDLDQKQRQTFKALEEREKDLKQLNQRYDKCAENNAALYVIGEELIRRYEGKGVMSTLLQKEPFTQIKKVELEQLVQDYRDRIDQQKVSQQKAQPKRK